MSGMTAPAPLDADALAPVLLPFGESRMLPRAAYVDDAVFAWERQHFFEGGWVCAGRSEDLAEPGAQRALRVGRTGVLLVRGDDGELRGFANICRHRGHELLACGATASHGVIQCPYHAWSYDLDGRLRLAPRYDGAADLPAGGLPAGAGPRRHLGGLDLRQRVGRRAPPRRGGGHAGRGGRPVRVRPARGAASHTYELAANWKLPHENYQECYHCPLIHPELCRVSPPHSGSNFLPLRGAWVGGAMDLAGGAVTMSLDGRSGGVALRGLSPEQSRRVLYVALFPNLLLSFHPDYVMTHRLEPVSTGETLVECQWLFPPEALERPDFDPSYAVDFWDLTNRQDWAAVESVQRSLWSPAFVPGVLAAQEDAVYQFVTMVARGYLGQPLSVI